MKKLMITLTILLMTLQATVVGDLYMSNLEPIKKTIGSTQYLCLDLQNAKILQAKLKYLDVMETSVSNLFMITGDQQMMILSLESDLYYEQKKKRAWAVGGVVTAAVSFICGMMLGN